MKHTSRFPVGAAAFALAATLALGTAAAVAEDEGDETTASTKVGSVYVLMSTTLGDILLELDPDRAPLTVDNFVQYVQAGFYDGTIFHRVVSNFMVQGGGFTPDMERKSEGLRPPIRNESDNGLTNARGSVAMARTGDPHSATAQFFINVVNNAHLNGGGPRSGYAVFGKVVAGMDTVEKIRNTALKDDPQLGMGAVVPETPIVIESVKLVLEPDYKGCKTAIEAGDEPGLAEIGDRDKQTEQLCGALNAAAKKKLDDIKHGPQRELEAYVANVEQELGAKFDKTDSGLMYVTLQEGTGDVNPAPTDMVRVHYTGWLLDGTKFDSSVDRGQPASFPLNRVIKGWTEGLGLMVVGQKCKFVIPWELAYGERGRPPRIPPRAPLVFDVELLGINETEQNP